jgi:glycerol dehydrogenase-like iron-containing ADH family enzyme
MRAEDPKRAYKLYIGFLAALDATIGTYEYVIGKFAKAIEEDGMTDFAKKLTIDAIELSLVRLKRIELRLEKLRTSLLIGIGGGKQ